MKNEPVVSKSCFFLFAPQKKVEGSVRDSWCNYPVAEAKVFLFIVDRLVHLSTDLPSKPVLCE